MEVLIQAGADVDKAANNGATALMSARENGHATIVEVLIQAGAGGITALIWARVKGYAAIVKALIQAGANATAMIWARAKGHAATVGPFSRLRLKSIRV